jgi:hypothetical protein
MIADALGGGERLSHCAVVGSSAVARYCDWAKQIEEIPYIIRPNLQPAAMYPDVVSGRTEIQFRFSTRRDGGLGHCSFTYFDVHENRTRHLDMCTGEGGAWSVSVHNAGYEKSKRKDIMTTHNDSQQRYSYTHEAANIASKCARTYGSVGSDASSGIRSVLFALLICKRVEVFNMWGYSRVTLGGKDYPLLYSFYTETGHGKNTIKTNKNDGAWVGFQKFSDELRYVQKMAATEGIDMRVHVPDDEHCSVEIERSRKKLKYSRP